METTTLIENRTLPLESGIQGFVPGPRIFSAAMVRLLGLNRIDKIYENLAKQDDIRDFLVDTLKALDISYQVSESEMERIPKEGPVVVVSNHPFGAIDGLILSSLLLQIRTDVKVMANYVLGKIPELKKLFVSVDPFGRKNSLRNNIKPLKETIQFLKGGGLVSIFPAGEVSHVHITKRMVTDSEWPPYVARLVKRTKSTVVPVFFEGNNSLLFQMSGLFHPLLRTMMLPREMLKKVSHEITLRIGGPISTERMNVISSHEELIKYLRFRTYLLKGKDHKNSRAWFHFSGKKQAGVSVPVMRSQCPDRMHEEIRTLPREQKLVEHEKFSVIHAKSHQIPTIVQEIGMLREKTFRAEQEGTGKETDLDRFDTYYTHLFLWDNMEKRVVGAYRLGLTDQIVFRYGSKGMYTNTLFEYDMYFLSRIGPAIELGRSFVRHEYQKAYQALLLLWKGIARYVYLNPQYKTLFGPVSISKGYRPFSRHLIVSFLDEHNKIKELQGLVKPRNPLKKRRIVRLHEVKACVGFLQNIRELSRLISEIEEDQKGIPILIKQYIKLGGRVLGFNVDPQFSDVLDALILVDLTRSDRNVMKRYFGKDETEFFIRYHRQGQMAVNDI